MCTRTVSLQKYSRGDKTKEQVTFTACNNMTGASHVVTTQYLGSNRLGVKMREAWLQESLVLMYLAV
jgi:hypothetical protein